MDRELELEVVADPRERNGEMQGVLHRINRGVERNRQPRHTVHAIVLELVVGAKGRLRIESKRMVRLQNPKFSSVSFGTHSEVACFRTTCLASAEDRTS